MAVKSDPQEVADLIRRFIRGETSAWEWDDFISISQADPALERLRAAAAATFGTFPSDDKTVWCSAAGIAELERLAASLRAKD